MRVPDWQTPSGLATYIKEKTAWENGEKVQLVSETTVRTFEEHGGETCRGILLFPKGYQEVFGKLPDKSLLKKETVGKVEFPDFDKLSCLQ